MIPISQNSILLFSADIALRSPNCVLLFSERAVYPAALPFFHRKKHQKPIFYFRGSAKEALSSFFAFRRVANASPSPFYLFRILAKAMPSPLDLFRGGAKALRCPFCSFRGSAARSF